MLAEFIDGLQHFHFLQNALITAIVIGVVAGAVGCFIILRGMSLMGDAISHAVLPGVALSFILGIDFFIGAIIFGLMASIIITYIKGNSIIKMTPRAKKDEKVIPMAVSLLMIEFPLM